MTEIKSKYYRKSRIKNKFFFGIKKIAQMGSMVLIGEYLLLTLITHSIAEKNPVLYYQRVPRQLINLAVTEKPILKVAEAYDSIKSNIEFDKVLQNQYPIQVKGTRLDFRTLDLQDKEGAKVGYVLKF